ncbi:MAG TPA: hypothetical protein VK698_17150 [Kofleriaceae bacterium]|nr:hypothetical protein [Kofleriaceae bacterium]
MSPRTFVLVAALIAAIVSGSGPAGAQPAPTPAPSPTTPAAGADQASAVERARVLHQEGLRYYGAGQYGRAVVAYRKAYALVPAPGILFNLAQAYRLRGDCRRAYRAYRNFLHAVTDSPEAKLAREHSQALRACAKTESDKAGEPALATAPTPPAPAPQMTSDAPVAAAPVVAEPPAGAVDLGGPRETQSGSNKKLVGIGIGAAGAALAVVGVYYGLKARGEASDLDDFFEEGGAWTPELADSEDSLDRDRALGLGFGLVGAAAIGTGAVLYWLGHHEASLERADQGPVGLVPRADGAMVTWLGAF